MDFGIARLIKAFRSAAIEKGDFAEEQRDHELYEVMRNAFLELKESGNKGHDALKELLHDDSVFVRLWVAAALLVDGNKEAYDVLKDTARLEGITGFSAKVTLKEFNAGRLSSPFPKKLLRD